MANSGKKEIYDMRYSVYSTKEYHIITALVFFLTKHYTTCLQNEQQHYELDHMSYVHITGV
jgi:hypothetical protein